ncbi:CLUMA_CG014006, isoform A [Clunio marinus]|uniref:CLUMA_CG014006, isoform A n=1 Tax=Clunio marinus TaxID=568069 RepID=A0A1J1INT0_9DIPT|nr:CLUMA_CG014006, isoform A [Clunio marinus]
MQTKTGRNIISSFFTSIACESEICCLSFDVFNRNQKCLCFHSKIDLKVDVLFFHRKVTIAARVWTKNN